MSDCSYPLSADRYIVNRRDEWNIEIAMLDKGIRLTTSQYQLFTEIVEDIEQSLAKNLDTKHHLGSDVYISTPRNKSRVDIWRQCEDGRKGVSLTLCEFVALKIVSNNIKTYLYDLQTPCFMRDDHQNQLGMLRCRICNPQEYNMWL